jgi:hypothetical protein
MSKGKVMSRLVKALIIWNAAWIIFAALLIARSHAADKGQYGPTSPEMHAWFNSLASPGGGLCCSFADGRRIEDVDWDTQEGHYRVRIDGVWYVVPDDRVVGGPNKFGAAVVWPFVSADGKVQIRCFLPGGGA